MLLPLLLESQNVDDAYAKIRSSIERTPVFTSMSLSNRATTEMFGSRKPTSAQNAIKLFFKAENLQKTGSFKFRGALNSIISLPTDKLACGLAATSSGNLIFHTKKLAFWLTWSY